MPGELEAPNDWDELYLARGDEVAHERPVFTGDVYERQATARADDLELPTALLVLQHPCALRSNGVDLVARLLAAEVTPYELLPREKWTGHFKVMPLPKLHAEDGALDHHAARFNEVLVIKPEQLASYERIANLSEVGVNLLLQRWVHHNSRVIVPTHRFAEVTAGPSAEAELAEEWVVARIAQGMTEEAALRECHEFLRASPSADAPTRQKALEDPQRRAEVRRAARSKVKAGST
jgi:hypothetical protein